MSQRHSFLKNIQRELSVRRKTQYLTDEERLIRDAFKRPEYANDWLELRRTVFVECEEIIQESMLLLTESHPQIIANIARNIVRFTWPFAASETHHHPHMGGLPLHLCETMYSALKLFKASNTPKSLAIEAASLSKSDKSVNFMQSESFFSKALFSLCLASLGHDVGKVFDQQLESKLPGIEYYPMSAVPEVWLAERNLSIEHVNLHWLPLRERERHAIAGIGILLNLLSPLMARKEYADVVSSFVGEHVLVPDPDSRELPMSNLSKIGTYMHLTNIAILYHNNLDYVDADNFVLNILRQADVDSTIEWLYEEAVSFTDFFKKYLKQEMGETVQVNDSAFLTIYARSNSRYVLIPIKRLYEGFKLFLDQQNKILNFDVDKFAYELARKQYAPLKKKGTLEPLLIDIRAPEIVKGVVKTIVVDSTSLGITFKPKKADLGIFMESTNLKSNDTLGMFYFTPSISEKVRNLDKTGKKEGVHSSEKQADSGDKKVQGKATRNDDFDSFLKHETVDVDINDPVEGGVLNGIDTSASDDVKAVIPGVPNVVSKNQSDSDSSVQLSSERSIKGAPCFVEKVVEWVANKKIGVNDFSSSSFILIPENEPMMMYIKVKDVVVIDSDFIPTYIKDLKKMIDKFWGEEYLIFNATYTVDGPKGGAKGDYLIRCSLPNKIKFNLAQSKGIRVRVKAPCLSLDDVLQYCGIS